MTSARFQIDWTTELLSGLISYGVTHYCIAPGSRSTPLTLAAAKNPQCQTSVHFDERSLGFHALGIAKSTQKPVGIITTSGTAVANLFPSVVEAFMDHVPLILLTADRPEHLVGTWANQTIQQKHFFQSYVTQSLDCSPFECTWEEIEEKLRYSEKGPVQINCRFEEPLYASEAGMEHHEIRLVKKKDVGLFQRQSLDQFELKKLARILNDSQAGIILVGKLESVEVAKKAIGLAEKLNWPIVADCGSHLRSLDHPLLISESDAILYLSNMIERSTVTFYIGGRVVSKTVVEDLRKRTQNYIHLNDYLPKIELSDSKELQFKGEVRSTLELLDPILSHQKEHVENSFSQSSVKLLESEERGLTDSWAIQTLSSAVTDDLVVFCGNSLAIRLWNQFALDTSREPIAFHANRGASGIDGLLSTAIGIAKGSGKKTLVILGDLSFLHDVTALSLLKEAENPVVIVVLNNNGGGIFSHLPIRENKDFFDRYFHTPHHLTFGNFAKEYGLEYQRIEDSFSFQDWLKKLQSITSHQLLELIIDHTSSLERYQNLKEEAVKTCKTS